MTNRSKQHSRMAKMFWRSLTPAQRREHIEKTRAAQIAARPDIKRKSPEELKAARAVRDARYRERNREKVRASQRAYRERQRAAANQTATTREEQQP